MLYMFQLHYCGQRLLLPQEGLALPSALHSHPKANHRGYLRDKLL